MSLCKLSSTVASHGRGPAPDTPQQPQPLGDHLVPRPCCPAQLPLLSGCWLTQGLAPNQHIWGTAPCCDPPGVPTHTYTVLECCWWPQRCGQHPLLPACPLSSAHPPGCFLSFHLWQGREFPWNQPTLQHPKLLRKVENNPDLTRAAGGRAEISLQEFLLPEESLILGKHHTSHSLRTEGTLHKITEWSGWKGP